MPLDPAARKFLDQVAAMGAPPTHTLPPAVVRAASAPVPPGTVGAASSTSCRSKMLGQPSTRASVGTPNRSANHPRTAGWERSRTSAGAGAIMASRVRRRSGGLESGMAQSPRGTMPRLCPANAVSLRPVP